MSKRTITIRFSVDKRGKRRAHYWGLARRWLPISIVDADIRLAIGEDEYGNEYIEQEKIA